MAYMAAFLFGLAAWTSEPIAAGILVLVGALLSFVWVRELSVNVGTRLRGNQQTILREIEKRNHQ